MENTTSLFENPISISTLIEITNKTVENSVTFLGPSSCFDIGPFVPDTI